MRKLFLAAGVLMAMLLPASSALGAVHNPTGDYKAFGECPLNNPETTICLAAETTDGFVTTGKKTVPIVNTAILQGGLKVSFDEVTEEAAFDFIPAEIAANTLSKAPQPVPGGLAGIPAPESWPQFLKDLYNNLINSQGLTGIKATLELAKPASEVDVNPTNLVLEEGRAVYLPVKIKLDNAFLGNNCYLGTSTNPIELELTTGTTSPPSPNEPISGDVVEVKTNPEGTVETVSGVKLVDNSFGVPGATGCGGLLSFLVDPFVNTVVGVPAKEGLNTAVLEGSSAIAVPEAVEASEP
jgi:hypothetical protein